MVKLFYWCMATVGTLTACGCAHVDTHDLQQSLLSTDKQWAVAVGGSDIDRIVEFWTDDAVIYTAGGPPVIGKEALRAFVKKSRAIPGFSLAWHPTEAIVSRSGDLGYTLGPYELTVPDKDGKLITHHGHYICIWRREGDDWRCSLEVQAPLPLNK